MTSSFEEYYVKRSGIADLLGRVKGAPEATDCSMYFPSGLSRKEIEEISPYTLPDRIIEAVTDSATGGIIFLASGNYLVLPPFPVYEKTVFTAFNPELLESLLSREYLIGLVLVHLGSYAVGVCRGDRLVSSKVGTGLVHGRTRKGGSSSGRFQRRRQNQAKEFLERVCVRAREHLELHQKTLDYLLYGGPHMTVLKLQQLCPFLDGFKDKMLPVLEVPPLKQKVLEATVTRLWSSRIIQWSEE